MFTKITYRAKRSDVQLVPDLAQPCVRSCEVITGIPVILVLAIEVKASLARDVPYHPPNLTC